MSLISKDSGGGDWDPVPEGTHGAVCITVVDMGLQDTGRWGMKEKVWLGFEIPGERVEWKDKDGNDHEGPALIGSQYTNSISPKAILGQHLVSWRGKPFTEDERLGFDLSKLLGAKCLISVVHNKSDGKTYANIGAIVRPPKGTQIPDAEGELVAYSPKNAELIDNLSKLPEWLQEKCKEGHGRAAESLGSSREPSPPPVDDLNDDIPF